MKLVGKETFSRVIDKVKKRLISWKVNSLSLAGRTTFVQSVMSAIAGYTVQIALLPMGNCDVLDRKNREFIWGLTEAKKKVHLVLWSEVCKNNPDIKTKLNPEQKPACA